MSNKILRDFKDGPINRKQAKMLPTLDGGGWIYLDSEDKLDRLLSNFFTTDALQSTLYLNNFITLSSFVARTQTELNNIQSTLENYLNDYLNKYFNKISVTVELTNKDGVVQDQHDLNSEAIIGVLVTIEYVDNGEYKLLNKEFMYKNGVYQHTIDIFNNGGL